MNQQNLSLILGLVAAIFFLAGTAFGWIAACRRPRIGPRRRDVERAFAADRKSLEKDVDALRRDAHRAGRRKDRHARL